MAYAGIGRFLFKHADIILGGAYAVYELTERKDVGDEFQARRCQVVLARAAPEDVVVNTFDFVNITSGALDTSWTAGDFTGVEARLRTFYATQTTRFPAAVSLREFRWSILPNPPGEDNPAVRVAPPATALTFTGTSTAPPQLAISITKRTAMRRHWGRIYMGPLDSGSYDSTSGRLSAARVDGIATPFEALRAGLQADDTPMIVYNRTTGVGLSVDGTRVDDVVDIVRSRRHRAATYRKLLP